MFKDGAAVQKHLPGIVYCTSEEVHFPVSELSKPIPSTRGWQSSRHCDYPQIIALRFDGEIEIHQMQFLANESKVPSRIDIFTASPTPEQSNERVFPPYEECVFERLGYVAFHSNAENKYKGGELRSIQLPAEPILYIQLQIWGPYEHPLNFYQQVGLLTVTCCGMLRRTYQSSKLFPISSSLPIKNTIERPCGSTMFRPHSTACSSTSNMTKSSSPRSRSSPCSRNRRLPMRDTKMRNG